MKRRKYHANPQSMDHLSSGDVVVVRLKGEVGTHILRVTTRQKGAWLCRNVQVGLNEIRDVSEPWFIEDDNVASFEGRVCDRNWYANKIADRDAVGDPVEGR